MASAPSRAERAFTVVALVALTGAVVPLLTERSGARLGPGDQNIASQAVFWGVYAVTAIVAFRRWRSLVRAAKHNAALWALVGLALVSVFWSDAPGVTLRRAAALLCTTGFGVYLAERYQPKVFLRLLGYALGMSAALSVTFVLVLPGYGISEGFLSGTWRGVYIHRNALGRLMALGIAVFMLSGLDGSRRWTGWLGAVVAFVLIVMSGSMSALVISATLIALVACAPALRWEHSVRAGVVALLILAGGIAATIISTRVDTAVSAIGRDVSLTGRTEIWGAVWKMICLRPWLGYGYNGFWLGWSGASSHVWRVTGWDPPHAHNGFLDLWLDLGLLGEVLFLASVTTTVYRSIVLLQRSSGFNSLFPLLFVAYLLLYNLIESVVLVRNSIFWVLYVTVALQGAKPLCLGSGGVVSVAKVEGRQAGGAAKMIGRAAAARC